MAEPIILPPRLDLSSVPAVLANLKSRPDGDTLVLDAAHVGHFGALGLQMVLAAAKTAGNRLQMVNVSDKALAQLHCMGMTPEKICEVAR
ncbi:MULTISPECIES: STAS domain-containing protein [Roseobacteraceae]|jgi:chemotaxis protein CheX|uniref:STAS domain protein n=1 Tax=Pseudosulfitobacter pseudonitzschiae TaxID=1402135 RepID=A0A221JZX0_9RHOB|nr:MULTISPECIES: STAS domain-containing protein [Roseobacteraceae]ASM72281.1 STAS domain protein [Pseudosulfitobacter pseudonitzschiae]